MTDSESRNRVQVVRTNRGARLVQDDAVLSEILARPGATHEWWDVLAACVTTLAADARFLMLGFAGGGIVAPLRSMRYEGQIEAVDSSSDGEAMFRELSASWAGDVTVHRADALAWLRQADTAYGVVLEDLSVPSPRGVVKPSASFAELPNLVASRLQPNGSAVFNLLPHPDITWKVQLERVTAPFREALMVRDDEYENRIIVASHAVPAAGIFAGRLRDRLAQIASIRASGLRVRSVKRSTA
jgi:hypothetical protein